MTIEEAAKRLREMYDDPATGKAVSVHLFGIKYGAELDGMSLKDVVERSGIHKTYVSEVNKGRNLSKYVQLK